MKAFFLTLIVSLMILNVSCIKNTQYSDKYVGDWDFMLIKDCFSMLNHTSSTDTVYYSSKIRIGDDDNSIVIRMTPEEPVQLFVDADGNLSGFPTRYWTGSFLSENELNLYKRSEALGGGCRYTVVGTKK